MADPIRLHRVKHEAERLKGMINQVLSRTRRSPGSVSNLDGAVLQVAGKMGVDPEDIKRYGLKDDSTESPVEAARAALTIAKQFGNTEEDITRYGFREPGSESETAAIEDAGRDLGDPALRIAEAFGNSPEDIQRFGN